MLTHNFYMEYRDNGCDEALKYPIESTIHSVRLGTMTENIYQEGFTWGKMLKRKGEMPGDLNLKITLFPLNNKEDVEKYLNNVLHNAVLDGYLLEEGEQFEEA